MNGLTENELLMLSAKTETRLEEFVKAKRVSSYQAASLARDILKEIGRPPNMLQDLIMAQALRGLREESL